MNLRANQDRSRTTVLLLAALTLIFLTGCAGVESRMYPEATSQDAAIIRGSWNREALTIWQGYLVMQVDGKAMSYGFMTDKTAEQKRIEAGQRNLLVKAFFNRGDGPQNSYLPIRADLQPSVAYIVQGCVSGTGVEIWLEEQETKKRASEIASTSQSHSEQPAFIPIFIPKR